LRLHLSADLECYKVIYETFFRDLWTGLRIRIDLMRIRVWISSVNLTSNFLGYFFVYIFFLIRIVIWKTSETENRLLLCINSLITLSSNECGTKMSFFGNSFVQCARLQGLLTFATSRKEINLSVQGRFGAFQSHA
jgi:hypothetical protein